MDEYAYIEILSEDKSGSILVEQIMQKYVLERGNITWRIHSFKGLGKIPPRASKISQVKSGRLLKDLPMYLKGLDSSLKNMSGKKAVFVILDSDDEDCADIKRSLLEMYQGLEISLPVFFCIAIEEIEAWLLGDSEALARAFPNARRQLLQRYAPDSIIGTWEYLAEVVYKGGLEKLKRNAPSYHEIGCFKCECARRIGALLDIRKNASPSFNYFIGKLDAFCDGA